MVSSDIYTNFLCLNTVLQVSEGPATRNCIPRYRLITCVLRDRNSPKQVSKTRSFREKPSLRAFGFCITLKPCSGNIQMLCESGNEGCNTTLSLIMVSWDMWHPLIP